MSEEADVDVTNQADHFDDNWTDDDEEGSFHATSVKESKITKQDDSNDEDQENRPPPAKGKRLAGIKPFDLNTIPEESRSHYTSHSNNASSRYSQQSVNRDSLKSTGKPEKSYIPTLTSLPETRKASISFDSKSFTACDDFERTVKHKEAEERLRKKYLQPRPGATAGSNLETKNVAPSTPDRSTTPISSRTKRFTIDSKLGTKNAASVYHLSTPPLSSSNTNTRSIPHNSSKPLTSTPISTRPGNRFTADISTINEYSRNNSQNEDSTFTDSKLNYMVKGIDLNQSSIGNAKNFVLQSKHIPKYSTILEEVKKKREVSLRSGSSALNMNASHQQKQRSFLPPPPQPLSRAFEHDAFLSRPSTSAASNSLEIAIKPLPLSHWGFVAMGEEVQSKIYVKNCSSHILEITSKLSDRVSAFKIALSGAVQIHPNCSQEFVVIFSPTLCKRYHQTIKFYVANSGKSYLHTLLGYGGTSDVKIIEKRSLAYFPRIGLYRFSPTNVSSFGFEIENYGERAAFVQVVPMDMNGNIARNITVEPETFCLVPKSNNPNDPSKTNITVTVPYDYLQQIIRMSLDSVRSSSTVTKNNIFSLKVYFGDERLRQRAKKYCEDANKHEILQGLSLTRTSFLLNGHEMDAFDDYAVSFQDMEMLKTQTRVLTLLIGDDRIGKSGNYSLPSRPPSSFSNRGCLENGYYIPECDVEADSTLMSVAQSDHTVMK